MVNEAQQYRELVYVFNNQGEIEKIDPAALQPGQYLRLVNMCSIQESGIRSRNGYHSTRRLHSASESAHRQGRRSRFGQQAHRDCLCVLW